MSLYGALFTGVSSLSANSRALALTSNNISNINTVGYKASETQFSTLLAATRQSVNGFASGGVRPNQINLISSQGLLQSAENATSLAVSGNGFFPVTSDPATAPSVGELFYTRAGSFNQDANGFLRNAAGYYLQGWELDDTGAIPANRNQITAVNVSQLSGTAVATDSMDLRANLQASAVPPASYTAGDLAAGTTVPHFERALDVYDSQGGSQPLRLSFVKTGANAWAYEVIYDGPVANIGGAANNPIATGNLAFNTNGTLATVNGAATGNASVTVPWAASSGLAAQSITVNFGTPGAADGFTQFDSVSSLINASVNGALFGNITGVRVDEDGVVRAQFDNGIERSIFKVPLGTFQNPNGLGPVNGNAYQRTDQSGDVSLLEANTGGAGAIAPASLEASTVDLASEFTDLITTQRAYSAATRIITTSDEMLEEVTRIKR
ncbi:MAG: flagellar hook protein FlgE [Alphaproteobacteria bacterium]|nr:flagellar hook protein FlgE [Alphaproteobacteria bacterium]